MARIPPERYKSAHLIFDEEVRNRLWTKTASSTSNVGQATWLRVEDYTNHPTLVTLHKTRLQKDEGPQQKAKHLNLGEEKVGNSPKSD